MDSFVHEEMTPRTEQPAFNLPGENTTTHLVCMQLPPFHLFHLEDSREGFEVESRSLVGSDPQLDWNKWSHQKGKEGAWKCGMLWTQGPPIEHLKEKIN